MRRRKEPRAEELIPGGCCPTGRRIPLNRRIEHIGEQLVVMDHVDKAVEANIDRNTVRRRP